MHTRVGPSNLRKSGSESVQSHLRERTRQKLSIDVLVNYASNTGGTV